MKRQAGWATLEAKPHAMVHYVDATGTACEQVQVIDKWVRYVEDEPHTSTRCCLDCEFALLLAFGKVVPPEEPS